MKTVLTNLKVVSISDVEVINGFNDRVDKRQTLILLEPGLIHATETKKNRPDNFYEVEVWNSGIEKFNLQQKFRAGHTVNVELWLNGKEKKDPNREKYSRKKYDLQLALSTIKLVE